MLVTRLLVSPHQAHVTFLDDLLSVGLQRSRTVCLSPLLNLNTLLRSASMDEANSQGLWHPSEASATLLRQWKAIKIANNQVKHSKTKHIEIRHHFLRDHVMKEDINIVHVNTKEQLADIFTKPLDEKRFCKLRCELNILQPLKVLWLGTHPNTYAC